MKVLFCVILSLMTSYAAHAINDNSCKYANDNVCDDGGPGAKFRVCNFGTDMNDCGYRSDYSSGGGRGDNSCRYANDNACDDGGPGSKYNLCALGTDSNDCGYRSADQGDRGRGRDDGGYRGDRGGRRDRPSRTRYEFEHVAGTFSLRKCNSPSRTCESYPYEENAYAQIVAQAINRAEANVRASCNRIYRSCSTQTIVENLGGCPIMCKYTSVADPIR